MASEPIDTPDPQAEEESISAAALYARISAANDYVILDVREEDEFERWRIEGTHTPETINIPYQAFFEDQDEAMKHVPQGRDVLVVCAEGAASDFVAAVLDEHERRAINLIDGMEAWGNLYVTRTAVETDVFAVYQVDRVARGCLSHVLVCDGQAVVIDPLRHIDQYTDMLKAHDLELALILDTHAHADHVSGGVALAEATGAMYCLHPYDAIHPFDMLPAVIPYVMIEDGEVFSVGQMEIEVIHTPGHTLGQVNYLVTAPDGQRFLFTGDNLFIESFGRPDLGGQGEGWAPMVYDTIFRRIKTQVPGDAWVLPGHYAQLREANSDGLFMKRLDALWRDNKGLAYFDEASFTKHVLSHLPRLPEEYIEIKRVNIGLSQPDEAELMELELGRNICALSDVY